MRASFGGFPQRELQSPAWSEEYPNTRNIILPYLNLFRHLCLNYVGQPRLVIKMYETNDPYLIQDLIQTRMQQLNIAPNVDPNQEYQLVANNPLPYPIIVNSNKITPYGIVNGGIPLFALRPQESIKLTLRVESVCPKQDAKYRAVNVTTLQTPTQHFVSNIVPTHYYIYCHGFYRDKEQIKEQFYTVWNQQFEQFAAIIKKYMGSQIIEFEKVDLSLLVAFCSIMDTNAQYNYSGSIINLFDAQLITDEQLQQFKTKVDEQVKYI